MTTLKGHVEYNNENYIWQSEDGACYQCESLDGKKYSFEAQVPNKPHRIVLVKAPITFFRMDSFTQAYQI